MGYTVDVEKYLDVKDKICHGHYHIEVIDSEKHWGEDGYCFFGNDHPLESIEIKFGIPYWNIAKEFESAYKMTDKYGCVFIKNKKHAESIAKRIAKELRNLGHAVEYVGVVE